MEPIVATVVQGYKEVHTKLREAVRGLDAGALNWETGAGGQFGRRPGRPHPRSEARSSGFPATRRASATATRSL
jgi:hypothetical protein